MIDGNYKISKLSENDLENLTSLFNLIKNKKQESLYFKNKLFPSLQDYVASGVVLYENELLIGFCGITNYFIENSVGEKYKLGQLGDLLIHPQYQGKGLFSPLLDEAKILGKEKKYDALFVFPNSNAAPIFNKKQDWLFFGELNEYVIEIKTFPLLKVLNKLQKQNLFYDLSLWLGSKEVNGKIKLNNPLMNHNIFGVTRDSDFIAYKSYKKSLVDKIGGVNTWWSLDDGISIGNIDDISNFEQYMNKLKFFCSVRGIHRIKVILSKNSVLDQLLRSKYEVQNSYPIFMHILNVKLNNKTIHFTSIDRNAF